MRPSYVTRSVDGAAVPEQVETTGVTTRVCPPSRTLPRWTWWYKFVPPSPTIRDSVTGELGLDSVSPELVFAAIGYRCPPGLSGRLTTGGTHMGAPYPQARDGWGGVTPNSVRTFVGYGDRSGVGPSPDTCGAEFDLDLDLGRTGPPVGASKNYRGEGDRSRQRWSLTRYWGNGGSGAFPRSYLPADGALSPLRFCARPLFT